MAYAGQQRMDIYTAEISNAVFSSPRPPPETSDAALASLCPFTGRFFLRLVGLYVLFVIGVAGGGGGGGALGQ